MIIFHLNLDENAMYLSWTEPASMKIPQWTRDSRGHPRYVNAPPLESKTKRRVRSLRDITESIATTCDDLGINAESCIIICSSTLDWPEDVTEDRKLIELSNQIRGNNV